MPRGKIEPTVPPFLCGFSAALVFLSGIAIAFIIAAGVLDFLRHGRL